MVHRALLLGCLCGPCKSRRKAERGGGSGGSGGRVNWNKRCGTWIAQCKGQSLGQYSTEEAAAQAYNIEAERGIGLVDLNVISRAGDADAGGNTNVTTAARGDRSTTTSGAKAGAAGAGGLGADGGGNTDVTSAPVVPNPRRSSQFKGVCWKKSLSTWTAVCKRNHLGCYATEEAAAWAYNMEAERIGRVDLNVIPPAGDADGGGKPGDTDVTAARGEGGTTAAGDGRHGGDLDADSVSALAAAGPGEKHAQTVLQRI